MVCLRLFIDIMAPKSRSATIKALKRRLVDKPSEVEKLGDNQAQLSWSIEVHRVSSDLEAEVPQTRVATALATQTQV